MPEYVIEEEFIFVYEKIYETLLVIEEEIIVVTVYEIVVEE